LENARESNPALLQRFKDIYIEVSHEWPERTELESGRIACGGPSTDRHRLLSIPSFQSFPAAALAFSARLPSLLTAPLNPHNRLLWFLSFFFVFIVVWVRSIA
jgi:hypothetical protein